MTKMNTTPEALGEANELQEKANELQGKANELQKQMIMGIKKNNTETSKHNNAIKWLTLAIVVLTFFTVLSNHNKTGRYTCVQGSSGLIIFDTKTNELWLRDKGKTTYYGTIKKPIFEIKEIDKEKLISRLLIDLEEKEKSLDRTTDELIPDEAREAAELAEKLEAINEEIIKREPELKNKQKQSGKKAE